MRNTFINTILTRAKTRDDIFIITGDAGLGVFDEFKEKFPERFLNLGVAEQNAAGFSAGMSLSGFKVYLYNIIPFLLYRCYEQVRNDICYQNLPVVLVGIGSGVTYAPQGMTHYSIEDLGITQTLPNLQVFSPVDPTEAELAALYSLEAKDPVYIRLAKRGEPYIHRNNSFNILIPQKIKDGRRVAIVFHGSIGSEVVRAREMLVVQGIYPKLISVPLVQPLDVKKLFSMFRNLDYVVSVEEHYVHNGIGGMLARECAKLMPKWKLFTLGFPERFIHEIKDLDGMREYFGISAKKIAEFVKNIIQRAKE